jgi:PadR family transcriptional regulator, regulatory protein PadR
LPGETPDVILDERELLRGNTPTLVLAVLRDAPLHGYAIAREINRRSGSALRFKQGTLYPALHALERRGWIAGEWELDAGERPRKVYRITEAGRAELERKMQAWRQFSSAVDAIIGAAPHEQPA